MSIGENTMPDEKKHHPLPIAALIAIFLWVVSTVFQVGAIYANNSNRDYVDLKTESIRREIRNDLYKINDKLDRIIENNIVRQKGSD